MASGSGQRNDSDKPREEGLSNTALAQIWAMLAEMVRNMPVQQGPSGPPGTPGEPGLPGLAGGNTARHEQFHGSLMMLAFSGQIFQPATARETSSIKGKNGITVTVAAATRDATTLRQNLDLCLKGEAQDWWTNQLSHVTRVGIMADNNGVEEWVKALEKRFREAPSVALGKLQAMRYTIQDAQSHREPSEYVTAIATAAKGCGQGDTEFAQVLHAFCGIDSNLRHFGIDEPEERTTIQEFIDLLNRKKVNWFNHYAQNEQKENKERRDQGRNIKQDCDRSQERLNQRGNRNQGQYQNSPMYQPIVPCQALNQISQPYGSNNQQQGFDQGFNQGRSYSQGYNLGGAQV
ncbi:MAG: hypothetical protein FRX49_13836 [Trebouxia sp. A1-2]|nr:MAG: hypothetical protein FRX49_13836 [Trebouxia sp. A1-2]